MTSAYAIAASPLECGACGVSVPMHCAYVVGSRELCMACGSAPSGSGASERGGFVHAAHVPAAPDCRSSQNERERRRDIQGVMSADVRRGRRRT